MDMYENNGTPQYQFETPAEQPKNAMSTAAMIMGILTIVTTIMCTVYIPFITCGLAILFAILSKGKQRQMNGSARTGISTGIIGICLNILLIGTALYMYTTVPEIHEQANTIFEQRYGISIDDLYGELNKAR